MTASSMAEAVAVVATILDRSVLSIAESKEYYSHFRMALEKVACTCSGRSLLRQQCEQYSLSKAYYLAGKSHHID